MKTNISLLLLILIFTVSCVKNESPKTIELSKNWKFSPDAQNVGISEEWFSPHFNDSKWDTFDAGIKWEEQ